jgi:hypothetical protein
MDDVLFFSTFKYMSNFIVSRNFEIYRYAETTSIWNTFASDIMQCRFIGINWCAQSYFYYFASFTHTRKQTFLHTLGIHTHNDLLIAKVTSRISNLRGIRFKSLPWPTEVEGGLLGLPQFLRINAGENIDVGHDPSLYIHNKSSIYDDIGPHIHVSFLFPTWQLIQDT